MTINNGEQVIDLAKALGEMARVADMVCVVRCKDCKHWYPDADSGMACEFTNMSQPEDGFCNWAEQKDGDADEHRH